MSPEPNASKKSSHGEAANVGRRQKRPEKLFSPVFVAIIAMTLCCFLVGQGTNAGTSVYLDRMGGTATLAGIGAAASPPQQPSRAFCADPSSIGVGASSSWPWDPPSCLVGTAGPVFLQRARAFHRVALPLQGMGFAIATTASATAAADVLPMSRLGEGIGYYGLGQAIAMSIGPALAMFLVSTDPAENLYLGFSAAAACARSRSRLSAATRETPLPPRDLSLQTALGKARGRRFDRAPHRKRPPSARRSAGNRRNAHRAERASRQDPGANDAEPESSARRANPVRTLIDGVFEPRALPGTIPMMVMSPGV